MIFFSPRNLQKVRELEKPGQLQGKQISLNSLPKTLKIKFICKKLTEVRSDRQCQPLPNRVNIN
ncbi:hypothetical protein PCC7424_4125 [Gloeothece citriformis PCC 7424]|uniref:Uncharacterized protein n=1 Tax=Gloeothece citriformis (strain PCC 7424) TaxID=65393 RepID=B7KLC4_GLOC7|nr:hypothetical protein PCC7424_4125 [Gloeothece citriformis PCC 7424]